MFGGKLVGIAWDIEKVIDLKKSLREGYIRLSGRKDGDLYDGYLFIDDGQVVGAKCINIGVGRECVGGKAFEEILEAFSCGQVRVAEVYEANVNEVLKVNPDVKIKNEFFKLPSTLCELYPLLEVFTGELLAETNEGSWKVLIKDGKVVEAEFQGNLGTLKGKMARRTFFKYIALIMKDGELYLMPKRVLKEGEISLSEIIELLMDKRKFEGVATI